MKLLLLVLVLIGCGSEEEMRPTSVPFSVMTFNVHHMRAADGSDTLERIAELIILQSPDVALLQEVDSMTVRSGYRDQPNVLMSILAEHGYRWYLYTETLDMAPGAYGIMMISKHRPYATEEFTLIVPEEIKHENYEKRVFQEASFIINGRNVEVINTHLDYVPETRNAQWGHLSDMMNLLSIMAPERAVILGGDFNATSFVLNSVAPLDFDNTDDGETVDHIFTRNIKLKDQYVFSGSGLSDHLAYTVHMEL